MPAHLVFVGRSNGVITDGRRSLPYRDVPEVFSRFETQLQAAKLERNHVLALDCRNSLYDALTLLYLLEAGQGVFVFSGRSATRPDRPSIPSFCRYRLTVREGSEDGGTTGPLLDVAPNPTWGQGTLEAERRLYLPTSGSTGPAKIAVHFQPRLLGNVRNCIARFRLTAEDRVTIPIPIAHMYGLGAAFLPAVAAGASVDLQESSNAVRFLARESEFRPTVAFLTPSFCEALLRVKRSSYRCRLSVTAGDRLSRDTFVRYERRFGDIVNLYGSTELGAIATSEAGDPPDLRARTVRLMSGLWLCPSAPAPSAAAPDRTVRELCLRHAYGFEGYVDEQGRSLERPAGHDDQCYGTKDLVRVLPGERLQILGRADHCVNRAGLLVAFSEIEEALKGIDGVDGAAVVSHGTTPRGDGIVAFCEVRGPAGPSPSEIKTRCRDRLAPHAIPDRVVVLPELPLLENGKIDRQRLVQWAGRRSFAPRVEKPVVCGDPA